VSRNLCSTSCTICDETPKLDGDPHPITEEEAGRYFDEYAGMIVCNARCPNCDAKYLAWVDERQRKSIHRPYRYADHDGAFVDLSFRSSFNDEPGPDDLPTPECLQRIHERECLKEAARIQQTIDALNSDQVDWYDRAATGESRWEGYRR
jgi:hypothetical protein